MATEVALKVDVCNHYALQHGLPGLLRTLDRAGAPASIFVTFGPDHSGRAIRRLLRPGFLTKMRRTRALRMYGFRTVLRGTLLPAVAVGESQPALLRAAVAAGHEVGLHGYDHVHWQDGVARMGPEELRQLYTRAITCFETTLGEAPTFTGAPGWQVTRLSLRVQDEFGFAWASDCRGGEPFYPAFGGHRMETLQIPTNQPTSDELLGSGAVALGQLADWYACHLDPERPNIVGVHAEAEGLHLSEWIERWLSDLRERGVSFVPLSVLAERERARAPLRRLQACELPGRVGAVACPVVSA